MEGFMLILATLLPVVAAFMTLLIPWVNQTRRNRCLFVGVSLVLECVVVALVALGGGSEEH
ncbi:MAG: hypothetical protein PHH32_03640, partial [Eubacteriales bacterium]|nr:hypothetical protein [Eubacteriales bacterium]